MLPELQGGLLPAGIHDATWDDVVATFGFNDRRRWLLEGLRDALLALRAAGCQRVYIDGSFVTDRDLPGDFDICWEMANVIGLLLDPVLLDIDAPRLAQHVKYRGDILPNVIARDTGTPFVDFFQIDKVTGGPKGILSIDPRGLK